MQEKSKLTIAVSVVSLLTAAVTAGINVKLLPAAAFWAAAAAFVAVGIVFIWTPLRALHSAWEARRRRARVNKQFRSRIAGLASVVSEIASSTLDSRGINSILSSAHRCRLLTAHAVNAYAAHLSTLGGRTQCIQRRAGAGQVAGISAC